MTSRLSAETPAGTVIVAPRVYKNLQQYRQTSRKNETGGALAGYKANPTTWVICSLMHPSPANKSGPTWLERDLTAAQAFADRVHRDSEGLLTYIGEWHTHPVKLPSPSGADIGMFNDILAGSKPPPSFLIGIILGIQGAICVWYQDRNGKTEKYQLPKPSKTWVGP